MRLLTHLLLGHVRGRCHGPTLAAQHGGRVVELAEIGVLVGGGGRGGNGRNAGCLGFAARHVNSKTPRRRNATNANAVIIRREGGETVKRLLSDVSKW